MTRSPRAGIGIIGGSGFYALLDGAVEVPVPTPYGDPSDVITVGEVAGRPVAFLPRHGRDHRFPPDQVPYRANLWALRSLGVRQVLGPCAVGGLRPELGPGTLVVPDQLVDRTTGRVQTYFDGRTRADGATPKVVHVGFGDPYCPRGRSAVVRAATLAGWPARPDGTLVVIPGPRFSTRAESRWYAASGGSVIGMTGHPEAVLARELALCYTCVALVTDLDAGVGAGEGVTHREVLAAFAQNVDRLRALMLSTVELLPADDSCGCRAALDGLDPGLDLPG